jgi:hypothetical protein
MSQHSQIVVRFRGIEPLNSRDFHPCPLNGAGIPVATLREFLGKFKRVSRKSFTYVRLNSYVIDGERQKAAIESEL